MKALIIDDELPVIVSVRMLVDWKRLGIDVVLESTSAALVPALIQAERPEIVITDIKMPDISGLDLVHEILRMQPQIKIIIISGFNRYEYMRTAMQEGCVDYILKPIREEQINAAVAKAVELYRQESIQTLSEKKFSDMQTTLSKAEMQKSLLQYFSSRQPNEVWQNIVQAMPGLANMSRFRIGIIDVQHFPPKTILTNSCVETVTSIFHNALFESGFGAATSIHIDGSILILMSEDLPNCCALCDELLRKAYEKTGVHLHLGLSAPSNFPADIKTVRDEAQRNAISYNLRSMQTSHVHLGASAASDTLPLNLLWFENHLFAAILSGSHKTILSTTRLCVKKMLSSTYLSIQQLERIRMAYYGNRLHWIESFYINYNVSRKITSPEFCFHMPFGSDGLFSEALLEQNLFNDICAVSDFFVELSKSDYGTGNLFHQIRQYISVNYAQKIDLPTISKQFSLNSSYLSRAFKQLFGVGIIAFLSETRIQHAMELLENQNLSIQQIALRVGYEDERYFSRVFKKQKGVSPNQYRSTQINSANCRIASTAARKLDVSNDSET